MMTLTSVAVRDVASRRGGDARDEGDNFVLPAGLIPERTAAGRAFHLWSSDGGVILSTGRTDADGTLAGARDIFGPRLFVCHWPDTGAVGTMADRPPGRGRCPGSSPATLV